MFSFDPPENIQKPVVFWCFQGCQKGIFGRKALNLLILHFYTEEEKTLKENYKPISILQNLSKLYEKIFSCAKDKVFLKL